jgi:hypothetical protein
MLGFFASSGEIGLVESNRSECRVAPFIRSSKRSREILVNFDYVGGFFHFIFYIVLCTQFSGFDVFNIVLIDTFFATIRKN